MSRSIFVLSELIDEMKDSLPFAVSAKCRLNRDSKDPQAKTEYQEACRELRAGKRLIEANGFSEHAKKFLETVPSEFLEESEVDMCDSTVVYTEHEEEYLTQEDKQATDDKEPKQVVCEPAD